VISYGGDVTTKKTEKIFEDETKCLVLTEQKENMIQQFKQNDVFDKKKKRKGFDTAQLRNEISSYLFQYLETYQIANHFVRHLSEYEMLLKPTVSIPIVAHAYNFVNQYLSKRLDLKYGSPLTFPIFEYYYKKDGIKAQINETHVFSLGILSAEDYKFINRLISKTNAVLKSLCERRNLVLADIVLELGRHQNQIMIVGELSPLNCFFWNVAEDGKIQKDYFDYVEDNAVERYTELRDRLQHK
jgi:phosphoribosylaminoimidazole-succinocarboxamide synthase